MKRDHLTQHLNTLLRIKEFSDYCPNGLQVEGSREIKRIITGVTACQALIDAAIEQQADTIIVHHGYFWKGEAAEITGMKKQRLKTLLENDINLFAYHLPLDAHPSLGNNVQFGTALTICNIETIDLGLGPGIGLQGIFSEAKTAKNLAEMLEQTLQHTPLHISAADSRSIRRIAWCTGSAERGIEAAALAGCDAYISGEISEQTVHIAREMNLHYFAAGHHATERFGVQALAKHLNAEFSLSSDFIDIPNPV
ncbi:MAG: Nif3-like dinuclear metal center hexameric protein [Gammaproteobacteria bacterium CG11_big_fil_rev_8_21_14_0_20_46_22]|nr:MAG: Nif3-like dinuclear metal center hexameric protein [Gammaproteobacteria bacterium CG11_big_fil_rev_8_21_14_0_20_46_22]